MYALTPWVKRLLIANVVMFFATQVLDPRLVNDLVFYPMRPYPAEGVYRPDLFFKPWTVVTYMFLHAGLGHIFFNMIGLFFFGPRLEQRLGGKDFLWLYFLSGLGGAVFSFFFARSNPIVGASGAVYGVLLGFALFWPRERIYIWGILPVEAWLLATILVGASLWSGLTGSRSGVAHFAHIGGLAFGYGFIKWREWRRGSARRDFQRKLSQSPSGGLTGDRSAMKRWEKIDVEGLHELNREEVRDLMEKARKGGARSLTAEQRRFLDRMAAASGG
ncbi:MAG: rhomboid family intramembrane serine protease [Gemmatimonadota bacterium]|jgi:membrane associated rhomboid family serine protease